MTVICLPNLTYRGQLVFIFLTSGCDLHIIVAGVKVHLLNVFFA